MSKSIPFQKGRTAYVYESVAGMNPGRKPCIKCEEPLGLSPDYIEELVAHKRASGMDLAEDSLYRQRLLACSRCDDCWNNELCRFCGCYVRFRALNLRQNCPHPEGDRWTAKDKVENSYAKITVC